MRGSRPQWRILCAVGHSNGASRERGSIALYLLFSIAASIAAGYGVYLLIRDRRVAAADDAVAESAPARAAPRPEPMPATPVVEATETAGAPDPAELAAVEADADIVLAKDTVLFGTPGVAGGLEVGDIERTIKRYSVRYERCMRRAKERGITPRGTLRLTFVVAADGNVAYATGKATNLDDELASCVVDVVKKLRFDKSTDGAPVKVVYPMAFAPAASDDPLAQ